MFFTVRLRLLSLRHLACPPMVGVPPLAGRRISSGNRGRFFGRYSLLQNDRGMGLLFAPAFQFPEYLLNYIRLQPELKHNMFFDDKIGTCLQIAAFFLIPPTNLFTS